MKKFILICVFAIMFTGFLSVNAQEVGVTVNGEPVVFDGQGPVNIDGRILVPARGVFDALGFTPSWEGELRQATLQSDQFTIVITIDSVAFTTNDVQYEFDVPAQIVNDATLIPLGAVLRSIGIEPGWDANTNTVIINTYGHQVPVQEQPQSFIAGVWDFMGFPYYTFNEDGSGFRGFFGDNVSFQWSAVDGSLTIVADAFTEYWLYVITGDLLFLASRQVEGFSFIYTRNGVIVPGAGSAQIEPDADNAIVGVWNWNEMPYYAFQAEGRGVRGQMGAYQHFLWSISDGVLLIHGVGHVEEWTYLLDGETLTLTSDSFGTFAYLRR